MNAGWDEQILAETLVELSLPELDFDLSLTGFDTVEINNLIAATHPNRLADDDVIPSLADLPVARLGDIWRLGRHLVICGSALEEADYSALMQGGKARMAFLDPPYNVPIKGHVSGLGRRRHREFVTGSKGMSSDAFTDFLTGALTLTAQHSLDGAIVYSCIDWRHVLEMTLAGHHAGLEQKNLIVWAKDNGGMGAFYRSAHELIFAFKHGTAKHLNNFGLGGGRRYRTNVWIYPGANTFRRDRDDELAMHPTVKPVALVADAIRDVSNRGDIVLDAFGGSGTTPHRSREDGPDGTHGVELDPLYVVSS